MEQLNTYRAGPDERGHFGMYGGRYVAETLMPLILDLEQAYEAAKADPAFKAEFEHFSKHYVGRPSPLYFAERHYFGNTCSSERCRQSSDWLNYEPVEQTRGPILSLLCSGGSTTDWGIDSVTFRL